jgi:DNA topoisomerase IA
METAGKTLEEKELSDAMKELGLGTPATRAQIIETLLRREYVVRTASRSWPPTRALASSPSSTPTSRAPR